LSSPIGLFGVPAGEFTEGGQKRLNGAGVKSGAVLIVRASFLLVGAS
jgi:hypothetical protein